MTPFFNESIYMCIFPIVLCIILYTHFPVSKDTLLCISSHWKITSVVLSILYLEMASLSELLKSNIHPFFKIIIIPLCLLSSYLLLLRTGTLKVQSTTVCFRKLCKTPVYLVMIPITLLSLFVISGCYPGVFSTDSASNWIDVATNSFSNWHPVTYLYILKVIQRIFGNPFPLIILQTLLWLLSHQYALSLLEKYFSFRHGDIYYTILSFIMMYSYRALGNIEKDTIWNIGVFLFSLFIYEFVKSKERLPWYKLLGFMVAACITGTIRHMGNIIVIVTFIVLILFELKQYRTKHSNRIKQLNFLLTISILVPILLINVLGNHILHMVPNENYVKFSVPAAMVGAVASQENLDPEDIEILEQIMPLEKWQSCYDKYFADSLSRTWGAIGEDALKLRNTSFQKNLIKLNAKFLIKYPKTYLTAYFDMTSIIWEMGTPADGYEWIPISIYSSALDTYPGLANLQVKPTISTNIQQTLVAFSDKVPVWSSICWRGGFSLFILTVCACLFVKKKRTCEVLALLPAFLLTGVLFLANPSQDPRYIDVYHMLMCFFVFTASA